MVNDLTRRFVEYNLRAFKTGTQTRIQISVIVE